LNETDNHLIQRLNLIDSYQLACRLINYFRNVLRFISAYIVVAFTLQRLLIIYKPLVYRFKTKESAKLTVLIIVIISFLVNLWVPLFFIIDEYQQYCDINKWYKTAYFYLNICYVTLIMSLPMLLICICNFLIITKTIKDDLKRNSVLVTNVNNRRVRSNKEFLQSRSKLKPYYLTNEQIIRKKTKNSKNYSKKITIILLVVSFSLVLLNLPYLLCWYCIYIYFNCTYKLFSISKI
jgi:hypothetical protein